MELDYADKKILSLLIGNCRLTNSQIAKRVGSSREVVSYRINRLEKNEIILGYTSDIAFEKIGYALFLTYLFLNNIEPKKINLLKKRPNILYLQESLGKHNLSCNILAEDFIDFRKEYDYIVSLLGKEIIKINSNMLLGYIDYSEDFFIKKKGVEYKFGDWENVVSIDSVDRKILRELGVNARQSLLDISEKVKSSVPTISKKIKKLKKDGVILRNTIFINYKKLGYYRYGLLLLINPEAEKSLAEFCNKYHQIWYIGKYSGGDNYVLEILAKNNEEFNSIVDSVRQNFKEYIFRYDILIATGLYKQGRFYM